MRVNARKVFQAFNSGQCYKKVPSFWTDGVAIYSYGTTLFEFDTPNGDIANPVYYFNDTRYSHSAWNARSCAIRESKSRIT